jgi:anti-sigma B factor antagonist
MTSSSGSPGMPSSSTTPTTANTGAFTVQAVEKFTVIEFQTSSLMDPVQLEKIAAELYRLVDEEDRRRIIMDFERVQYLSSQAIGIVMAMRKKLAALKHSRLILCGVGSNLQQLLKITGLDKLLMVKPSQKEAIKVWD